LRFEVLTPVLNGARFLDAAIASVRAQTWSDWRLTVLDAGSTDGSVEIVERHAAQDDRIRLQSEPDEGMYDALRRGFDQRAGDVLCWLNSDDLYTPWALDCAAQALAKPGCAWVSGFPAHWDCEGRLAAILPAGWSSRWLINQGWRHDGLLGAVQQESVFFKQSLWDALSEPEKARFASLKLAGDFFLWKRFARSAELTMIPSVLGGFRVHDSNASRLKADAYAREVRDCGGVQLPGAVAGILRRIYDAASSYIALRAFRRAAAGLHADLRERS